jgi:hypothetical protein
VDHRKKGSGSTSSQSEGTIRQYALTTRVCPAASSFQWPTVVHKTGGEKAAMVCPLRLWETAKPTGLDRRRERFETKQGSRLRGAPSEPLMRRRLVSLLPAAAGCRAPLLVLFRAEPHLPFPEQASTWRKWRFDGLFHSTPSCCCHCRVCWKWVYGTIWDYMGLYGTHQITSPQPNHFFAPSPPPQSINGAVRSRWSGALGAVEGW